MHSGSFELDDGSEDERLSREIDDQYFAGGDVADALGLDLGPDYGYVGASSSAHGGNGFDASFDNVNLDYDVDMGTDMGVDMNMDVDSGGNYGSVVICSPKARLMSQRRRETCLTVYLQR